MEDWLDGSSSFVLDFHVPAISFLMEDWLDVLGPHHLCLIFINFLGSM